MYAFRIVCCLFGFALVQGFLEKLARGAILKTCRLGQIADESNTILARPLRIIIAGAPASGKGTQCEFIRNKFGLVHLSTGDILRKAVREMSELGVKAKPFMDCGSLVPDEIIMDVVCERLSQKDCLEKGWLLDGFPRTGHQAEALFAQNILPDCFLFLDVSENLLLERVCGRRSDIVTGNVYHLVTNPPPTSEIAARCIQRDDDTAEKVVRRYKDFKRHIDDIIPKFTRWLVRIDGSSPPDMVSQQILCSLQNLIANRLT